ncbi:MAG: ATP-binding protein [bacterium]
MRRFAFWAVALAVLAIVVFNVQGWLILRRTSRALENELGERLQAVGLTIAAATRWPDERTGPLLEQTMRANNLHNVFVVSEALEYLANARDSGLVGTADPALELDADEVLAAFSGVPTRSKLYNAGGYFLKTAYVPLADSLGLVSAVLGVEADARFFSVLGGFRSSLLLINALSLLAIAAIVLVSASLARRALALERAAARSSTLALLGQLSAAVAHDIRNPLGIIRASAERLKKKHGGDEPDPAFDYITEEVDRLDRVVAGYLNLGRAQPAAPEPVDVAELVRSVVADLESELRAHAITAELDLGELPRVTAGRIELRQAFLNILLNAIQAQPGGGSVRIGGAVERRGRRGWLVLRFADSGPGIEPRLRGRVFEPFFTTREKGSGLGLFSVRRAVESCNGRVTIGDAEGKGTVVEVSLPL